MDQNKGVGTDGQFQGVIDLTCVVIYLGEN